MGSCAGDFFEQATIQRARGSDVELWRPQPRLSVRIKFSDGVVSPWNIVTELDAKWGRKSLTEPICTVKSRAASFADPNDYEVGSVMEGVHETCFSP